MSHEDLPTLLSSLHHTLQTHDYQKALSLLSRAKRLLLAQNALIPSPSTPSSLLTTARSILEAGALVSIRLQDPEAFTRYYQQLQPFYDYETLSSGLGEGSHRSKITGLYLLLLLSQGDYAGFHTLLEGLVEAAGPNDVEEDIYIRYPIELERSLMEGSYDKVWRETKGERVPSEEFGLFSNVTPHLPMTLKNETAESKPSNIPRFSSTQSAPKSPPAPRKPTPPSPSAMPKTCSSSTATPRCLSSRIRGAGS
jgi:26S proteasome regulatory subunit N12